MRLAIENVTAAVAIGRRRRHPYWLSRWRRTPRWRSWSARCSRTLGHCSHARGPVAHQPTTDPGNQGQCTGLPGRAECQGGFACVVSLCEALKLRPLEPLEVASNGCCGSRFQ